MGGKLKKHVFKKKSLKHLSNKWDTAQGNEVEGNFVFTVLHQVCNTEPY